MADEIKIEAKTRTDKGSGAARRLRREKRLPAVFYNAAGESILLELDAHGFGMMLGRHASENLVADISIDGGGARKVLLKEVQHDMVHDGLLHVDFIEISMTEKMRVMVTIELTGEPAGVREGGVLEHLLREVEVECLPGDLLESFEMDVSALNIGDSVAVGDLDLGAKFTILTDQDVAVASVAAPRVADAEDEDEEGAEEGAEEGEGEQAAADTDGKSAD